MKLWVVNHPHRYRRWLKVEARLLGERGWHEGYIWAEWHDHSEPVPTIPRRPPAYWNVDPLVIGPHMYFDYCRKGTHRNSRRNFAKPNSLKPGDIVLFGCLREGKVLIDTVFPVGAVRDWGVTGLPSWSALDPLALAVHFHDDAHGRRQHVEVHRTSPVMARSYRATPYRAHDEARPYAWVPFRRRPPRSPATPPFVLRPRSRSYRLLRDLYDDGRKNVIERRMKGSFKVILDAPRAPSLFSELRDEACSRGFKIAVEIRLLSGERQVRDGTHGPCASAKDRSAIGGAHAKSRAKGRC